MFSVELSLVKKTILSQFNRKIKSQYLETDLLRKNKYEKEHSINWDKDKCLICNFPLKIDPIGPDVPNNGISYGDFSIRCEHKFLKNIYSKEQLTSSSQIKTLKDYHQTFKKFLEICTSLQSVLISHVDFDDCDDESDRELKDFLQTNCAGYDLDELLNQIDKMDIKNITKNTDSSKIPKFHL